MGKLKFLHNVMGNECRHKSRQKNKNSVQRNVSVRIYFIWRILLCGYKYINRYSTSKIWVRQIQKWC